jgi:hypothetical protein
MAMASNLLQNLSFKPPKRVISLADQPPLEEQIAGGGLADSHLLRWPGHPAGAHSTLTAGASASFCSTGNPDAQPRTHTLALCVMAAAVQQCQAGAHQAHAPP